MTQDDTSSLFSQLVDRLGDALTWYRVPKVFGLAKLRRDLRKYNLYDTENPPFKDDHDPAAAPQEKVSLWR